MKLPWLLRDPTWRTFHVHRCLECKRRFCDEEPGSWADFRDDEFPELCSRYNCRNLRHGGRSHGTGCRSRGPFCPDCAARVEAELIELREMYRD